MMKRFGIIVIILFFCGSSFAQDTTVSQGEVFTVERVIDGDTLKISNGEIVELIGIDSPESDTEMGQEATEFLIKAISRYNVDKQTLEFDDSYTILLEFDVQERDKYGRWLAYVFFVGSKGESPAKEGEIYHGIDLAKGSYFKVINGKDYMFLNATMIGSGYATPMTIPPNVQYAELFEKLHQESKENKMGLWIDRGIPLGPQSEAFFDRVEEAMKILPPSDQPMMVDPRSPCDLDWDGDCDTDDLEIFKKQMGKCIEPGVDSIVVYSDLNYDRCVDEKDLSYFLDVMNQ
jgi:micrococcal nuclease